MNIDISKIGFEPSIPSNTMIIICAIMAIIVLFSRKHIINKFLIIIILLIISQRPIIKIEKEEEDKTFYVIFVADNSVSMNANDSRSTTRIKSVKKDLKTIVDSFSESSYALINFNNISSIKHPFTTDKDLMKDIISRMNITNPVYSIGTSLDLSVDDIKKIILTKEEDKKVILFFISDGESLSNVYKTNFENFKEIAPLIYDGAVLGYGTKEGGKIDISSFAETKSIIDSNGFLVNTNTNSVGISRLNEDNLKNIASNLNLDYYNMNDKFNLSDKIKKIKNEDDDEEPKEQELYYYFTGILIIPLFIELLYCRRSI